MSYNQVKRQLNPNESVDHSRVMSKSSSIDQLKRENDYGMNPHDKEVLIKRVDQMAKSRREAQQRNSIALVGDNAF